MEKFTKNYANNFLGEGQILSLCLNTYKVTGINVALTWTQKQLQMIHFFIAHSQFCSVLLRLCDVTILFTFMDQIPFEQTDPTLKK